MLIRREGNSPGHGPKSQTFRCFGPGYKLLRLGAAKLQGQQDLPASYQKWNDTVLQIYMVRLDYAIQGQETTLGVGAHA